MITLPDCIELHTEEISVTVEPPRGAKVSSLRHTATGREWLLQAPAASVWSSAYGDSFTDAPLYGWDEMFPTVDSCRYDGAVLPDHGEVWSRPWQVTGLSASAVSCQVTGVALPYVLRRAITVSGHTMRAQYSVETPQIIGIQALWAPHPQLTVRPNTVIILPDAIRTLTRQRERYSRDDLVEVTPDHCIAWDAVASPGEDAMLYANSAERIDTITFRDPNGDCLTMHWTGAAVSYFAMWIDNLRYSHEPVVCPEPMTGAFDNLSVAKRNGQIMKVQRDHLVTWSVEFKLGRQLRDVRS